MEEIESALECLKEATCLYHDALRDEFHARAYRESAKAAYEQAHAEALRRIRAAWYGEEVEQESATASVPALEGSPAPHSTPLRPSQRKRGG